MAERLNSHPDVTCEQQTAGPSAGPYEETLLSVQSEGSNSHVLDLSN